jgi:chromosome segregation ATPase
MAQEDEAHRSSAAAAAASARASAIERQLASMQRAGSERDAALAQARAQLAQTEERLREMEEAAPALPPARADWRADHEQVCFKGGGCFASGWKEELELPHGQSWDASARDVH